jgi:lysophospholipase L1-like esterase
MRWVVVAGAVAAVFAAALLAVELLLRHWIDSSSGSSKKRFFSRFVDHGELGKGSWTLSAEVMAMRDPDFSSAHWRGLTQFLAMGKGWERWSVPRSSQRINRIKAVSFVSSEFSIQDRKRLTTGQPSDPRGEVLCLGGSTTFCYEVADRRTWASVLQRRLNERGGRPLRVQNLGIGGTPGLERIYTYRLAMQPQAGDVAVFLFGHNDSGQKMYGSRSGMYFKHLPRVVRLLLDGSRVSELAAWIYGEVAPRYLQRLAVEMAETTITAAEEAAAWARARGAHVLFVLQPHIFTLAHPDDWDRRIIAHTARDLPIMLQAAYTRYRRWIETSDFIVSATHIFDRESPSPYMGDWGHVNTRGNELIAEFIFSELVARGMLGPVEIGVVR